MSSLEFAEWMAYDKISPGEPERTDYHNANIIWRILGALSSSKSPKIKFGDCILRFNQPNISSVNDVATKLKSWKAVHDAEIEDRAKKKQAK